MKILIIEDDQLLAKSIQSALFEHDCCLCFTYEQAINEAKHKYDCYLMDIQLPDGNGLDICEYIRTFSNKPILFISSSREEEVMIHSYELGGDDYIEKPVRLSVLRMKIKRIEKMQTSHKLIQYEDNLLDINKQKLENKNSSVSLTSLQSVLLKLFFEKSEQVIIYGSFLKNIQDETGSVITLESLKVRISELRKKIEGFSFKIVSVSRIGYKMVAYEK